VNTGLLRGTLTFFLFVAVPANAIVGGVAMVPAFAGLAGWIPDVSYGQSLQLGSASLLVAAACFGNVRYLLSEEAGRRPFVISLGNAALLALSAVLWVSAWPYRWSPSIEVYLLALVAIGSCGTVWGKSFMRASPLPGA